MTSDKKSPAKEGIEVYKFWNIAGMGLPVNIEMLAPEFTRRYCDPLTKVIAKDLVLGVDGLLHKRKKGDWYIVFNEAVDLSGRKRFTQAHEFGHYLLHRASQDRFQCGTEQIIGSIESNPSRYYEAEANKFASYLLMPIDDFKLQIAQEADFMELIKHCADRYDVSFTAATLKWLEFTEEAAILVAARDDFILWSFRSERAKKMGVYFSRGTELPTITNSHTNTNQAILTPPGVWHQTLEAKEYLITSDRFDFSLHLVIFPQHIIGIEESNEGDVFDVLTARAEGFNWAK